MRKNFNKLLILILILGFLPLNYSDAAGIATRLKGRILLQVESNGAAWYINPENEKRYYLGRPADAFQVMRELGLGISNKDFDSFNGYAPTRLSGKFLLKVEDSGKAYYINPVDLKMHYLGRPADAFRIMRELGLGITNNNLYQIFIASNQTLTDNFIGCTARYYLENYYSFDGVETCDYEMECNIMVCDPKTGVSELFIDDVMGKLEQLHAYPAVQILGDIENEIIILEHLAKNIGVETYVLYEINIANKQFKELGRYSIDDPVNGETNDELLKMETYRNLKNKLVGQITK